YNFCRNSPYYEMVAENINREIDVQEKDSQKQEEVQKINDACKSISKDLCSFENSSSEDFCKKVLYMYKFLDKVQSLWKPPSTITNEDLDFLNYWLNVKLKDKSNNSSMCIGKFIEIIKSQGENFISVKINLIEHLHVIDPNKLENMELLCELYDTKQKITDIMFDPDRTKDKEDLCKGYTKTCYDNYKKSMDNCLDEYDDFYAALKMFERGYKYLTDEVPDKSGYCKISEYFQLPEYDPVLETKQRRIMTFKIMSAPLMLPFVIPLLYK
ncbi:PIR Superfamily Protein, partial [Plasmodium ovale curtisi]